METIDKKVYEINTRDDMYIGKGTKDISFESKDPTNPAKFYLNSTPAHTSYSTVHIKREEVGIIDILVNNASIIIRNPMLEMEADEFRKVIDVDLNAPFIKAVIGGMKEKGHGKIINVCSMMSKLGCEIVSAYAAAKGGLKMLTKNIYSEYGEFNI